MYFSFTAKIGISFISSYHLHIFSQLAPRPPLNAFHVKHNGFAGHDLVGTNDKCVGGMRGMETPTEPQDKSNA